MATLVIYGCMRCGEGAWPNCGIIFFALDEKFLGQYFLFTSWTFAKTDDLLKLTSISRIRICPKKVNRKNAFECFKKGVAKIYNPSVFG